MEKIKLLLYCTKSKPYLMNLNTKYFISSDRESLGYIDKQDMKSIALNGEIVAECDFEVEKIEMASLNEDLNDLLIKSAKEKEILKQSCLSYGELADYVGGNNGYAIHIKNLHIFDNARDLWNYETQEIWNHTSHYHRTIMKAPQNMMYAYGINTGDKYILISIRPEWLCKILNGEKTIEVRRKVLKEMINNA